MTQSDARRHGVTAALDEQLLGDRAAHRAPEVDARDRPAGAGADAAGLERDGESRPLEALLQARRHQADDARMPPGCGGDDDGAALLDAQRRRCLGFRRGERRLLERPALAVEAVEFRGELRRFRDILRQQQPRAEIGAADAAARVDARPEQKAEVPGLGRTGEARDIHERGEPDALAPAHGDQALGDEGAVEPFETRHVGDGAERDQIEQAKQVGLRPCGRPEAACAQRPVGRDQHEEHEAGGGEITEARQIVEPVGIDDRERGRQLRVGLVVIDDDRLEPEPLRLGERVRAGGAAIDGHEKARAFLRERPHRLDVGPIALEQPVGNVDLGLAPGVPEKPREQRRRRGAVHVVIAEDRDALAADDGVGDARRRDLHAGDHVRVRHQPPNAGIEEAFDRVDLDAAPGEDARQKLGYPVPLHDRERARGRALVEPVAPRPAADRALDPEKGARAGALRQG